MSNWIERLQEEKDELALKLKKLRDFFITDAFMRLKRDVRDLMFEQERNMVQYIDTLERRLAHHDEEEDEDERMKNIVRNGNDGEHYRFEVSGDQLEAADKLTQSMKGFFKACDEHVEREESKSTEFISDFDIWWYREGSGYNPEAFEDLEIYSKHIAKIAWSMGGYCADKKLDSIAETEITPKALLKLGFEEEYQPPIDNQVGYLYYTFEMWGIELMSNASDEEGWYVFNDDNQEIHNLRKLGDLILSLKEL